MLKGVIFDLDGVIVNTVHLHFDSWKYLFATVHGLPFTMKDYDEKVDGRPRLDSIRLLLPHLSEKEVIAAGEVKQKRYIELLNEKEIEQFPASIKLVKELHNKGILLAAASSSKNAKYIIEKINLTSYFTAIISGYDFTNGKPHPEIFLNAANALKLDVKECIVFEDAMLGVQAAKAGNFYCIGIDRNNHPSHYTQANLVVKDLAEVDYDRLSQLIANK